MSLLSHSEVVHHVCLQVLLYNSLNNFIHSALTFSYFKSLSLLNFLLMEVKPLTNFFPDAVRLFFVFAGNFMVWFCVNFLRTTGSPREVIYGFLPEIWTRAFLGTTTGRPQNIEARNKGPIAREKGEITF